MKEYLHINAIELEIEKLRSTGTYGLFRQALTLKSKVAIGEKSEQPQM